MLLQSYGEELDLLPALPPLGRWQGARALRPRGYTVNLAWRSGKLISAEVTSVEDRICTLLHAAGRYAVSDGDGRPSSACSTAIACASRARRTDGSHRSCITISPEGAKTRGAVETAANIAKLTCVGCSDFDVSPGASVVGDVSSSLVVRAVVARFRASKHPQ